MSKTTVLWSPSARDDLKEIVQYLKDKSPKAARELADEVRQKVAALALYPQRYAVSERAPGYRQLTVRTNYLVFYKLDDEEMPTAVEVEAVVHARRQWPA